MMISTKDEAPATPVLHFLWNLPLPKPPNNCIRARNLRSNSDMNRRIYFIVAVAAISTIASIVVMKRTATPLVTKAQIDRELKAQIPPHFTKNRVKLWLSSRHIGYGEYARQSLKLRPAITPRARGGNLAEAIVSSIEIKASFFRPARRIVITFLFSRDGKLIEYHTEEIEDKGPL